jgi:hypothetical protein
MCVFHDFADFSSATNNQKYVHLKPSTKFITQHQILHLLSCETKLIEGDRAQHSRDLPDKLKALGLGLLKLTRLVELAYKEASHLVSSSVLEMWESTRIAAGLFSGYLYQALP